MTEATLIERLRGGKFPSKICQEAAARIAELEAADHDAKAKIARLEAALATARAEERERAAKIVDGFADASGQCARAAAAIRSQP